MKIHGKEYVTVNSRLEYFRQNYPEGRIITEITFPEFLPGEVVCKATIFTGSKLESLPVAIGHAHEVSGSSQINKTSYIENCETSAIGRALGILGIGIEGSVVSAEEVENAINQQMDAKEEVKPRPAPQKATSAKSTPKEKPSSTKEESEKPPADINHNVIRWDQWRIPWPKSELYEKSLGELTLENPEAVENLYKWCGENWDLSSNSSKAGMQRQVAYKYLKQAVDDISRSKVDEINPSKPESEIEETDEDDVPF